MFFPYGTDAPLYHYPITTVGLIVANVVIFFSAFLFGTDVNQGLILTFDAVRPTQWLTMNFAHGDILHLLGNMVFLWSFGLIVEGKLGWFRFLAIYLTIGILCGAVIQLSMLGEPGGALGASAAIFGTMGLALVWAPKNNLSCVVVYWLGFFARVKHFEVSIATMAMVYTALNLVFFAMQGFGFSGEAGHLLGLVIGLPIGIVLLKWHLVDCEGWDIFAVLAGKAGRTQTSEEERADAEQVLAEADARRAQQQEAERATALGLLRSHLAAGRARIAYAVFDKHEGVDGERWELPEDDLCRLIGGLDQENMWSESVPLLRQVLQRFPRRQIAARLQLAKIMAQAEQRPKQALAVLAKLPLALNDSQRQDREAIEQFARRAIEQGEVELEVMDW